MKLEIDVNDKQLDEIINKGIKELSLETVAELCKQAIVDYVTKPEIIERIIFKSHTDWSGSYYVNRDQFTDLFESIIMKGISEDELKKYRELFFKQVGEINKTELMSNVMATVFVNSLMGSEERRAFIQELTKLSN